MSAFRRPAANPWESRMMMEGNGATPLSHSDPNSYAAQCRKKYSRFLRGMPSQTEYDQRLQTSLAMLYENEMQHLRSPQMGAINEATGTSNVGGFTKFIFPLLRRVFPNLIANEIVSVQPMTAPIGAVFLLDYLYANSKGATTAGNIYPRDFDRNYTSDFVAGEPCANADGVNYGGASGNPLQLTLAWTPVRPLTQSGQGWRVQIKDLDANGLAVQTATDDGNGGFTGDVNGSPSINYANGAVNAFKFATAPVTGHTIKAYYYYDKEGNTKRPQVGLDVKMFPIQARTRDLKAFWTAEAQEDFRAFQGQDIEAETLTSTAQLCALEIDREIIDDIFQSSTGSTAVFDRTPPSGITELDHLRGVLTQISSVSAQIHRKTGRAPANFIVTSTDVSAVLEQLMTHASYRAIFISDGKSPFQNADMPRPMTQHGQYSIYKLGTLNSKWLVYADPYFARDMMLIGLRGSTYVDAGYVWAPYIPFQVTPTFLDPSDVTFKKAMRTRYATKLLRNEYYGQLRMANL
jgi:hypothetical protein